MAQKICMVPLVGLTLMLGGCLVELPEDIAPSAKHNALEFNNQPVLVNASVSVFDIDTGDLVARGTTDAKGRVSIPDFRAPSDIYLLRSTGGEFKGALGNYVVDGASLHGVLDHVEGSPLKANISLYSDLLHSFVTCRGSEKNRRFYQMVAEHYGFRQSALGPVDQTSPSIDDPVVRQYLANTALERIMNRYGVTDGDNIHDWLLPARNDATDCAFDGYSDKGTFSRVNGNALDLLTEWGSQVRWIAVNEMTTPSDDIGVGALARQFSPDAPLFSRIGSDGELDPDVEFNSEPSIVHSIGTNAVLRGAETIDFEIRSPIGFELAELRIGAVSRRMTSRSGSVVFDTTGLADGSQSLRWTLIDDRGDTYSGSTPVFIQNNPIALAITSDTVVANSKYSGQLEIEVPRLVNSVSVNGDGRRFPNGIVTFDQDLLPGPNAVDVEITDQAGNTEVTSFSVYYDSAPTVPVIEAERHVRTDTATTATFSDVQESGGGMSVFFDEDNIFIPRGAAVDFGTVDPLDANILEFDIEKDWSMWPDSTDLESTLDAQVIVRLDAPGNKVRVNEFKPIITSDKLYIPLSYSLFGRAWLSTNGRDPVELEIVLTNGVGQTSSTTVSVDTRLDVRRSNVYATGKGTVVAKAWDGIAAETLMECTSDQLGCSMVQFNGIAEISAKDWAIAGLSTSHPYRALAAPGTGRVDLTPTTTLIEAMATGEYNTNAPITAAGAFQAASEAFERVWRHDGSAKPSTSGAYDSAMHAAFTWALEDWASTLYDLEEGQETWGGTQLAYQVALDWRDGIPDGAALGDPNLVNGVYLSNMRVRREVMGRMLEFLWNEAPGHYEDARRDLGIYYVPSIPDLGISVRSSAETQQFTVTVGYDAETELREEVFLFDGKELVAEEIRPGVFLIDYSELTLDTGNLTYRITDMWGQVASDTVSVSI